MSREMSRGEMIRRLDEASKEVHDRLANGPLTPPSSTRWPPASPGCFRLSPTACKMKKIGGPLRRSPPRRSPLVANSADPE